LEEHKLTLSLPIIYFKTFSTDKTSVHHNVNITKEEYSNNQYLTSILNVEKPVISNHLFLFHLVVN